MAKITGFMEFHREKQPYRPVEERLKDWNQVMAPWPVAPLKDQAARCMDCGIPFCHQGCPLGNLIPEWNDLVYRINGWQQLIVCMPPIISRNSPVHSARLRVKVPVYSALTMIRSPLKPLKSP